MFWIFSIMRLALLLQNLHYLCLLVFSMFDLVCLFLSGIFTCTMCAPAINLCLYIYIIECTLQIAMNFWENNCIHYFSKNCMYMLMLLAVCPIIL